MSSQDTSISRLLRARRKELGLSMKDVARRADTSVPTLSRYETGWARFELATLQRLATALRCDLVVRLEPAQRKYSRVPTAEVVTRLRRLFWDVPLTEEHLEKHALWVVERVLELGAVDDIRMLTELFGREEFLELVREARFSSDRTRAFWKQVLSKEGKTCTKKSFQREAAGSWRG